MPVTVTVLVLVLVPSDGDGRTRRGRRPIPEAVSRSEVLLVVVLAYSIPYHTTIRSTSAGRGFGLVLLRSDPIHMLGSSVLASEGHGQAVERQREGAELHAALGLGGGPPVLGGEVVEEHQHLQLGELVARARVGPVAERHERVGLGSNLQHQTEQRT